MENNIKTDFQAIGCGVEWTDLAQDKDKLRAVFNSVMNIRFHKMRGIF
jgi:hypothetical protein